MIKILDFFYTLVPIVSQFLLDIFAWLQDFFIGSGSFRSYANILLLFLIVILAIGLRKHFPFKNKKINFFVIIFFISIISSILAYIETTSVILAIFLFIISLPAYYMLFRQS